MGIGVGAVLLVLGLVLVTRSVTLPAEVEEVVATTTAGWILVVVGALALGLAAMSLSRRHTRVDETRTGL